jgi:predicted RNase H-like HicB family nuclease
LAVSSDLKGCLAEGDTIADALANIEDASRVIIEYRRDHGWALPPELLSESLNVVEAKLVVQVGD